MSFRSTQSSSRTSTRKCRQSRLKNFLRHHRFVIRNIVKTPLTHARKMYWHSTPFSQLLFSIFSTYRCTRHIQHKQILFNFFSFSFAFVFLFQLLAWIGTYKYSKQTNIAAYVTSLYTGSMAASCFFLHKASAHGREGLAAARLALAFSSANAALRWIRSRIVRSSSALRYGSAPVAPETVFFAESEVESVSEPEVSVEVEDDIDSEDEEATAAPKAASASGQ